MEISKKYNIGVFALLACLFVPIYAASAAPHLSKEKIATIFTGNTAIGIHEKKKLKIRDYYGKKGKFISRRSNGDTLKGKWWIGKKHDVICIRYQHKPKKRYCRSVVSDGTGGYNKIGSKTGKVYIRYQKFVAGKKYKF